MAIDAALSWQPSLLDDGAPAVDRTFAASARLALDARSWVDVVPGWLSGADELFERLIEGCGWQQRNRWMYERRVDEPRLTASWKDAEGMPRISVIAEMQQALSDRYGVRFDSGGLNLYRDGRDSVAWHGDRIPAAVRHPLVAVVSLGHERSFRLRPKGGGKSVDIRMHRGDLLVTGGRCQREWEHAVPKVRAAGPRLSITFRHSEPAPDDRLDGTDPDQRVSPDGRSPEPPA